MNHYIGIDVGGMSVKGLIIDGNGNVKAEGSIVTNCENGGDAMCANISELVHTMLSQSHLCKNDIAGVGVGCPGLIDSKNGIVVFAGNLCLRNFPLSQKLEEILQLPVKITNDANAAALGEARFGAGKEYSDSILITLGTGVGGGIIIDGKLFEGYRSAGAEIGHMVIVENGSPCSCGRKGCFEAYSSASALIKKTKEEMQADPASEMWKGYNLETVNGKTAFEYPQDHTAQKVIEWYIRYLACGIVNLINIFRPQAVMLGGGISKEGERLTKPLQAIVDKELFGGTEYSPVKIITATLGNRAGAFGAAALNF